MADGTAPGNPFSPELDEEDREEAADIVDAEPILQEPDGLATWRAWHQLIHDRVPAEGVLIPIPWTTIREHAEKDRLVSHDADLVEARVRLIQALDRHYVGETNRRLAAEREARRGSR